MEEKVLALTYDNKIVRIPREKLEELGLYNVINSFEKLNLLTGGEALN